MIFDKKKYIVENAMTKYKINAKRPTKEYVRTKKLIKL